MSDIIERLQAIFRVVLENPRLIVTASDSGHTVERWHSLAHVSLTSAAEQESSVRLALGELEELRNIGDMIHPIAQMLGVV